MGRKLLPAALAAAVLLAAACSGGSAGGRPRAGPTRPIPPGAPTSWLTYHAYADRSGSVPGLPPAGQLAIGWSRNLDGAVYGQPLVIGDLVIAATENDSVYGLDWSTGQVRWRTHIAAPLPLRDQPCGDIDPLGITSTPVFYRGLVYALAQVGRTGHVLVGIEPATGAVAYRRTVPSPDGRPRYDQQRGALTAVGGRIYVTFGGHAGDCGPYAGAVVGMPAAAGGAGARGAIISYLVPTTNHGGIWAPGGPAIGTAGTLFVGVGNGATSGRYDDTDSVTNLSPRLHRIGVFAPVTWIADNNADLDLGSMTPALTPSGEILMDGKRGVAYLLDAAHLGGIGGQRAKLAICPAYGSAAVTGQLVILPCSSGGPAAVRVSAGRLTALWRGPPGADGSPVIGGGAVWVTGIASGVLYQVSLATGRVLHRIGLGSQLPHFESPSLSGPLVLVGTLHGVVAVTGA